MCKISVIVPVYNVETYLRECLNSIIGQSLRDIEIICINDGSTDQSGNILQEYTVKDSRIRVIEQENAGYGHTINVGLQESKGEYISIVESDDYIEKNMYEKLYAIGVKHSLDFVKADFAFFRGSPERRTFDRVMICPRLSWYWRVLNPTQTPQLLDVEMMNVTGIYRRTFLQNAKITLKETPGALYQDTGMWFQIFMSALRCMFIPHRYYNIRRDNPNSSVMQTEKFSAICNEYDDNYSRLRKNKELYAKFAPYLFRRKVYIYMFILSKVKRCEQAEIIKRFAKEIREGTERKEYRQNMFTSSIRNFLKDVCEWREGREMPLYTKNRNPLIRFAECLYEHGIYYTLKRIFTRFICD